ncbi:MAG: hypothetical protein OEZ38_13235 [Gammaproteobacteria bacterium]|nr:hypothetical protein [Gammaproteobacteria bacterium]
MGSGLDFFKSNPPGCLDEFDKVYVDDLDVEFDGHGEDTNPIFKLVCKCGNETFNAYGYDWVNPDTNETFYVSPLSAKCTKCSCRNQIFDIKINGYDAVLGHGYFSARGEGDSRGFECPSCNDATKFELFVRFEYTDDIFDEDFTEFTGREKELFTWFSLHGRCASCKTIVDISEDECA